MADRRGEKVGTAPDIDWTDPITEEEVQAFLDAKNVRISCELCEATSWLVYPNTKLSHMNTVLIVCGNCGNLRWHVQAVIRRWKGKGH